MIYVTDIIARALAVKALNNSSAKQYDSKLNFPSIGKKGELYIDTSTGKLYYWDENVMVYMPLNGSETGGVDKEEAEAISEATTKKILNISILDCTNSTEN